MEKNKFVFSIIIPAYNAEKYIINCLYSVINQTYKDFEIIIVNDGSIDNTRYLIEQTIEKHEKCSIKLINIPNGGLANARNVGIREASGKYFINLDSDDFLDNDILEKIASIKEPFDICFYGWKDIEEDTGRIISQYPHSFLKKTTWGPLVALKKIKKEVWICQGSAVYRTEMIRENGLWNIKGINQGEDLYFIMRALIFAKQVISIPVNAFNCTIRKESMMHSSFNISHLQVYNVLDLLLHDVEEYNLPSEIKAELLSYIRRDIYCERVNVAKKIVDSFRCYSVSDAIKYMEQYCSNCMVNYEDVKTLMSPFKRLECSLFRFSKLLFFFTCKLYRRFQ